MARILIGCMLFSFFPLLFNTIALARPTLKVTAVVVDENRIPIKGAKVTIGYMIPNPSGIGTDDRVVEGESGDNGIFSSSGDSFVPQCTIHAGKDGYYQSGEIVKFKSSSLLLNRWEPWNPTIQVVLKKKRNPAAMIMGGTGGWIHIPRDETPIGFDLEKGDWVSPYGRGMATDFTLTCHSEVRAYADYDVSIDLAFPGSHNGIQELFFDNKDQSSYKWPFEAPLNGYQSVIHKKISKQFPGKGLVSNLKKDVNYLYRVRSAVNAKGELLSANYGKIAGEIDFDAGNNGGCDFRIGYTFNPDTTRNLEEDPKKNLFKKK